MAKEQSHATFVLTNVTKLFIEQRPFSLQSASMESTDDAPSATRASPVKQHRKSSTPGHADGTAPPPAKAAKLEDMYKYNYINACLLTLTALQQTTRAICATTVSQHLTRTDINEQLCRGGTTFACVRSFHTPRTSAEYVPLHACLCFDMR